MWKWKWKTRQKPLPFTDEEIRAKAYELWKQRGDESSADDNWNDAIAELARDQQIKRVLKPVRRLWWRSGLAKPVHRVCQWTGVKEKKGWDFMQLLLVPALLAIGGFWLNQQASQRQDDLNQKRHDQDQQLADDKAKQDTLVKYLDQMADSLKDGLLQVKPDSDKFIVAQSRTVIALQSLDKKRQHLIIQFLQASGLNKVSGKTKPDKDGKVQLRKSDRVLLYQAQMSKANLANSDLSGGALIGANLTNANLGCIPPDSKDASQCSDLSAADLSAANLSLANLSFADLSYANLSHANLRADNLSHADLRFANLSAANLRFANLSAANLSQANLSYANLSYAFLVFVDLRQSQELSQQQLEGKEPPLLCNVALPKGFTVNPNRDCDRIPQVLHELYPQQFKTIEYAQVYVNEARQKKWD